VAITKSALAWSVGIVDASFIDRYGIQAANRLALLEALRRLPIRPNHVVVDAFRLPLGTLSQDAFPRADGRVLSVAAASIIAKVVRDHLMECLDAEAPGYNFTRHKGYGTEAHRAAIERLGLSALHRRSFDQAGEIWYSRAV
jgi:ribonuclease HII